jgi:uncharacterized membrane protein YbhN (UPF0104 family)
MLQRQLILCAKVAFSIGLVWYVAHKFDFEATLQQLRTLSPLVVVAVVLLYYVQLSFAAQRFREFLGIFGISFGFLRAADATLIGYFFSQTFISFVGGDAMRLFRAAGPDVDMKTAAKAIVLDRASGFVAQVAFIVLVLPFLLPRIPNAGMKASLVLLVVAACAGAVAVFLLARLPSALRKFKALEVVADISSRVLRRITSARGVLAFLGYSFAIGMMNVVIVYALALGLNIPVSFLDCLILLPVVFFLSMLPISVSGWGVREGAMIVALGFAGVSPAHSLTLSISFGLGLVLISLPGGLLWLFAKKKRADVGTEIDTVDLGPTHAKD